jgi:pimeloyl-ACP methyl ester carboxylesterase
MENPRKHGNRPFTTAVVHGGPGAYGGLASVARVIANYTGVLEPIQTKDTVDGQVEELHTLLLQNADPPVMLIGFSWGAWLSFITAAKYPKTVKKLILVDSGPFEQKYADNILPERINRLNDDDKANALELVKNLDDEDSAGKLFDLIHDSDVYARIDEEGEDSVEFDIDIYRGVWPEAARMRKSGELLKLANDIQCPVTAIHGDYDPHPAEGVQEPLSAILDSFRFILLEKCGHDPQIEKYARDRFYDILKDEIIIA